MKTVTLTRLIPVLTAGLFLAAPAASFAKDKHKQHRDNCRSSHRSVYVSRSCSPYNYSYGHSYSRPYYSSSHGSRYYTPRASIGFSLFTSPTYYSSSRSSRYYPSSYSRSTSRASYYSDDLAEDVQRALRRGGYYYGDIDGDIGPESRAAIREYQRDRGLPATGRIDSSLLRSLRIS